MPAPHSSATRLLDRPEFAQKPPPLTLPRDATVTEAVARMSELEFGSVIVVDAERRVEGLVTERDVMKRVLNARRDPDATLLGEIMTSNPRIARAEDNLLDWLRIMSNERFRRLPVVDAEGRILAVMTQGDFVSYTWPDLLEPPRQALRPPAPPFALALIGGGIMLYSLILILLLRLV